MKKNRTVFAILVVVAMLATAIAVPFASADAPTDTSALRDAVTLEGIVEHLEELEDIGPRPAGTLGYNVAAQYVADQLLAAGYQVTVQPFDFAFFEVTSSAFSQTSPIARDFEPYDFETNTGDYDVMTYSGSGVVTDVAVVPTNDVIIPYPPTPNTSNSGCEPEDFLDSGGNSLVAGKVALIQRGSCYYSDKAQNAEAAGAVAALVFNEGQPPDRDGVLLGRLLGPGITIPVVGISYYLGVELFEATDPRVSLDIQTVSEIRSTSNVLAETSEGRDDRVVVVGAHLDTEAVGPGINDNGSGVATILEIAQEMTELGIEPRNKVVFAFWSAEEVGLLGAEYYVSQLGKRGIKNTALNLNFDMLASHNYALFVYDGDGSATPLSGPTGSANIEDIFVDYFDSQGLVTWPTAFDGRSDYGPFIEVGIPAGGLFSGGDGIKTEEQVAEYGGTAGEYYDPFYHTAGDTLANINTVSLDYMSDAVAHNVLTFAMTRAAVPGTAKGSTKAMEAMEYKGPKTQR